MIRLLAVALACVGLTLNSLLAADARREDFKFGADLASAGWQVVTFLFITPTTFKIIDDATVEVVADSAAGMAWRPATIVGGGAMNATWSWRVLDGVGPTDLSKKGADDRLAAVYFVFGEEADRSKSVTSLLASPTARALVYVLGGNKPKGALIESPHMGTRGRFIILQPADAPRRQWMEERVDLQADYARTFGGKPAKLLGVAISSDSDDTRGLNRVWIRGVRIAQ